jgi:hypothetical protein
MLKAKLIAMNNEDEYEVTLEVNGVILMCFAVVCPYKINIGKYYPVEFSLNMKDGVKPEVLKKEAYGFEKTARGYGYVLRGKLSENKLDLGSFSIEDDYLKQLAMLDGKYIEIAVQGLWVTFLPPT